VWLIAMQRQGIPMPEGRTPPGKLLAAVRPDRGCYTLVP
jgi:hypothetical protein